MDSITRWQAIRQQWKAAALEDYERRPHGSSSYSSSAAAAEGDAAAAAAAAADLIFRSLAAGKAAGDADRRAAAAFFAAAVPGIGMGTAAATATVPSAAAPPETSRDYGRRDQRAGSPLPPAVILSVHAEETGLGAEPKPSRLRSPSPRRDQRQRGGGNDSENFALPLTTTAGAHRLRADKAVAELQARLAVAWLEAAPLGCEAPGSGGEAASCAAVQGGEAEVVPSAACARNEEEEEGSNSITSQQQQQQQQQSVLELQKLYSSRLLARVTQEWRAAAASAAETLQHATLEYQQRSRTQTRLRALRAWRALCPAPDAAAARAAAAFARAADQFRRAYRLHTCLAAWRVAAAVAAARRAEEAAMRAQLERQAHAAAAAGEEGQRRAAAAAAFRRLYLLHSSFTRWRSAAALAAALARLHLAPPAVACAAPSCPVPEQHKEQQVEQQQVEQQQQQQPPVRPPVADAKQRLLESVAQRQRSLPRPSRQRPVVNKSPGPSRSPPARRAAAAAGAPVAVVAAPPLPLQQGAVETETAAAAPSVMEQQLQPEEETLPQPLAEPPLPAVAAVAAAPAVIISRPQRPPSARAVEADDAAAKAQARRLREVAAELAARQTALARAHYARSLLLRCGLAPWRLLLHDVTRRGAEASAWHARRVCFGALSAWRDAVAARRWQNASRAAAGVARLRQAGQRCLLARCVRRLRLWAAAGAMARRAARLRVLSAFKATVCDARARASAAMDLGKRVVLRAATAQWHLAAQALAAAELLPRLQREARADAHRARVVATRALRGWARAAADAADERAAEARREALRAKARGWLAELDKQAAAAAAVATATATAAADVPGGDPLLLTESSEQHARYMLLDFDG